LDGNAAGGLLNEVFPFEMTAAATTCSGCSATKPIGELMLYGHGMGTILRCTGCDVVRKGHIMSQYTGYFPKGERKCPKKLIIIAAAFWALHP
jgi:hypothetical protein